MSITNFLEYQFFFQGKRALRKHLQVGNRKSSDMRSRLEEMISTGATNRQEFLRTRKQTAPPSPQPDNNRKWHKTSFLRNAMTSGDSLSLLGVDASSANSTIVSMRHQGMKKSCTVFKILREMNSWDS